ncbi:hypothetical protein B9Z65_6162 [Elsinoe australis]|uniref:Rhodopsin domain-containing protein n=1 Tax=Elsinoe australis TaxID=40998 RepID=A0A2P8A7V2_9PEZI|nr:hypothetical protein B9Z65_6162 [Elsinoe australis]
MSEVQITPAQTTLDNAKNGILGGATTLVAISALFIIGRLYSHLRITKSHSFEDLFILVAWTLSLSALVCEYRLFNYLILILDNNFDTLYLESYLYWIWNIVWLYMTGLAAIKFSIASQYKRLFITTGFQRYVKLLFVVLSIYGLFLAFSTVMFCSPVHFYWTRVRASFGSGKCLPFGTMFLVYTALNIITDIMIVASPLPVLARMHLPVRQNMSLFALFTIGGTFMILTSIIKLLIFRSANLSTMFDAAIKNVPLT